MSYNDTFQFLNSLRQFGWRLGLNNITTLLNEMGNPHLQLRCLHIAGTNGKGSTAAMLESMYGAGGYKTGLYTSPHLCAVTERIRVNGEEIPENKLAHYLEFNRERIQRIGCTYFEALTAVAFQYFVDEKVELAFIEVGLGGRFDATNVITPLLSIITEIDLDHTDYLGRRLLQVANEKAGIIKNGVPCLSGSKKKAVNDLLRAKCHEMAAPFYPLKEFIQIKNSFIDENSSVFDLIVNGRERADLRTPLLGRHQIENSALAVAATDILGGQNLSIPEEALRRGLRTVRWPGRLQKLQDSPTIVIDVAHNPAGIRELLRSLPTSFQYERLILVIGLLRDKDYKTISKMIAQTADLIIVTTPNSERALSPSELAKEIARHTNSYMVYPEINQAYEWAQAHSHQHDLICVTGSHYLVGEFLKFYKKA